jgi:hypothetical protein
MDPWICINDLFSFISSLKHTYGSMECMYLWILVLLANYWQVWNNAIHWSFEAGVAQGLIVRYEKLLLLTDVRTLVPPVREGGLSQKFWLYPLFRCLPEGHLAVGSETPARPPRISLCLCTKQTAFAIRHGVSRSLASADIRFQS